MGRFKKAGISDFGSLGMQKRLNTPEPFKKCVLQNVHLHKIVPSSEFPVSCFQLGLNVQKNPKRRQANILDPPAGGNIFLFGNFRLRRGVSAVTC